MSRIAPNPWFLPNLLGYSSGAGLAATGTFHLLAPSPHDPAPFLILAAAMLVLGLVGHNFRFRKNAFPSGPAVFDSGRVGCLVGRPGAGLLMGKRGTAANQDSCGHRKRKETQPVIPG